MANYTQAQLKAGIRTFYTIQKEVRSMPSCKTGAALKSLGEKSCEITQFLQLGCFCMNFYLEEFSTD